MLIFPKDILLESSEETNRVIALLHETNKSIRSRLILLSILFIVAVGFVFNQNQEKEKSYKYYTCIRQLENLKDTSDIKAYLDLHESSLVSDLYFVIDAESIIYKVKQSNYKDKSAIVEGITELKKTRNAISQSLYGQNVGLLGVSIPLTPLLAIATLILFIVYHDYAQKSFYRLRLLYALKKANVKDWLVSFDGLPYEYYQDVQSFSMLFLNSLTKIVISLINLLVLIAGFLYISMISDNYDYGISDLLESLSAFFLGILLIEVVIVCFQNNYFYLQTCSVFIHEYLSIKENRSTKKVRLNRIIWPFFCLIICVVFAVICDCFTWYFIGSWLLLLPMCSILPIAYYLKSKYKNSLLIDMTYFTGIVTSAYWIVFIPITCVFFGNNPNKDFFMYLIGYGINTTIVAFVVSPFYSAIYRKVPANHSSNEN